ncbi:MAG: hypothetical protein H7124_02595 [Phycisphaerales bacterium]|nr:hypothetical protein [Hyphomonadaceae bacterium]
MGAAPDPIIAVRDRAYDLASTGQFTYWRDIVSVLQSEGAYALSVSRLDAQPYFQMMLRFRIREAKRRLLVAPKG